MKSILNYLKFLPLSLMLMLPASALGQEDYWILEICISEWRNDHADRSNNYSDQWSVFPVQGTGQCPDDK